MLSTQVAQPNCLTAALSRISTVEALSAISDVHLQPFLDAFSATSIVGLHQRCFAGEARPRALAYVNQQPTWVEDYLRTYHAIDPLINYWMTEAHKECSVFRLSDARRSAKTAIDRRYEKFLGTVDVGHILVFNINIHSAGAGLPGETILLALQRKKELYDFSNLECHEAALIAPILRQVIRGIGRNDPYRESIDMAKAFLACNPEEHLVVLGDGIVPVAATSAALKNPVYYALSACDDKFRAHIASVLSKAPDGPMTGLVSGIRSIQTLGKLRGLWLAELEPSLVNSQQDYMNGLTPRQREVAGLVSKGFRNYQIADILHISENTVVNHLSAIYDRLRVNGRTELAVMAAKNLLH